MCVCVVVVSGLGGLFRWWLGGGGSGGEVWLGLCVAGKEKKKKGSRARKERGVRDCLHVCGEGEREGGLVLPL